MVVYGDGNIHPAPLNPLFAMKTQRERDGIFYKPAQAFSFVKVEEWFLDTHAEGDQVGASVTGYSFPFPDYTVDLRDYFFETSNFGTQEGGPGWNYQADINADHWVNLKDVYVVALNFASSGSWYSNDLSNIWIEFHFADGSPQAGYPDSNGFVAVPWNCMNWTIYQQDLQVGAFLTFWG
jgi:hypothetical protein